MQIITKNQIAQAAAQLKAQGQHELAALVQSGTNLATGVCQIMGYVPGADASPASTPVLTPADATPGGCGCNGGGGGDCKIPGPNGTGANATPSTTPSSSSPVGGWNCQTVTLDLSACQIAKIEREESLPTLEQATITGPLAAGDQIAVLFIPASVSHKFCVDFLQAESVTAENVATNLAIAKVELQTERIFATPEGPNVHAWTWGKPERPDYLGITDGRCACKTLCDCVAAEARVRLIFTLPTAIADGSTLRITVWGNRDCWQIVCGPCPPALQCDHVELTEAEAGYSVDTAYAVA